MAYDVEKLHQVENALRTTADLVGESKVNKDGINVGLGLNNETVICLNAAEAVKEGVFKTIVMGTFTNGKSSIINALLGSKVLPEAIIPSTAIVSYLRYGEEGNNVVVYFRDGSHEELSYQDFQEKYKYTTADAIEARETGEVKRFANVHSSVLCSNMELLKNGVQIIDSPGLEDKACATRTALEVANTANAIIYTGTASAGGFNTNDQDFFKSNFEGKHLNNVFFLINKADLLGSKDLDAVKEYHKTQLSRVFTNQDGQFDEQLYSKRVFYVSAKYMLEYKTGDHSEKYDERDLPDFRRFEKELEEFLTTDARSIATFNTCFAKIANAYKAAIHTADLNKVTKEKGVDAVREDMTTAEAKLAQMEVELDSLRKSFDVAKTKTQSIFENQMNSIVDRINNTWDVEMNRIIESSGFSTFDLMKIAWLSVRYLNNEEKRNEEFAKKIEPITSGVQRYITKKVEEASSEIVELTKPVIKQLSDDIQETQIKLDGLFNDIYKLFEVGKTDVKKGKVNIAKLLISWGNGDANVMIEVLAGNDIGWADFLKRTLVEALLDSLLFGLVGGPIGLALFVLKEWWALKKGRGDLATTLAKQTKDGLLSDLRRRIGESSEVVYSKFNNNYDIEFSRISKGVQTQIAQERSLLEDTKNKLDNAQFDYDSEIRRCEYIIDKIWDVAHSAYTYVFDRELTKEKFESLSVQ